jgi:hypothetical protein
MFTGCQSVGTVTPDAPGDSATTDPDGTQLTPGMFVTWKAQPPVPGPLTSDVSLSAATFQVSHLQVVGDAGPGDERTTRSRYLITWNNLGHPALDAFPSAPVGVYSQMTIDLAVGVYAPYAYQLEGTWRRRSGPGSGGADQPFRIIDRQGLSTAVDCAATLGAGGNAMLTIDLELEDALGGVDFEDLDVVGGVLVLDTFDRQMPAFRDRMRRAFRSD